MLIVCDVRYNLLSCLYVFTTFNAKLLTKEGPYSLTITYYHLDFKCQKEKQAEENMRDGSLLSLNNGR